MGALGLVLNMIVLWNTIYMEAVLNELRAEGYPVNDEDVARLSPLLHEHGGIRSRCRKRWLRVEALKDLVHGTKCVTMRTNMVPDKTNSRTQSNEHCRFHVRAQTAKTAGDAAITS